MQLTARQLGHPFRFRLGLPARRHPRPAQVPVAAPVPPPAARTAGPSQDRALYACVCGFAWKAEVVATVDCPHCGSQQAW